MVEPLWGLEKNPINSLGSSEKFGPLWHFHLLPGWLHTLCPWEGWWQMLLWKLVTQSCLTLWDSMVCSPPGFSVHGILQARILKWVAIPFSRGSYQPRGWIQVSHIGGRCFTIWATRDAQCWWEAKAPSDIQPPPDASTAMKVLGEGM